MNHNRKIQLHPTLNFVEDIQVICRPLKMLGITYFAHVKVIGNKFSAISNNPAFIEHYLQQHYYNVDIHTANSTYLGPYVLWDGITRYGLSEKMHIEAGQFGVLHTFSIIEKEDHVYQFFHFATNKPGTAINQIYLSQLDFLKLFILYFKDTMKSSKHLNRAYELEFTLNKDAQGFSFNEEDYKLITPDFVLKKFDLPECTKPLTKREISILKELHSGNTISQIAHINNIAEITVNKTIANIKEKTDCKTHFQLGEFFARHFEAVNMIK